MNKPSDHPQLTFNYIHAQEILEIKKRREKQSYEDPIDETHPNFVGLALSGGGIRSATFCLGFLQEFHRLRLLRIFDYLSTVSGGGYVGGWWSAWLSRKEEKSPESFFLKASDIHYPVSLLNRISEAPDRVAAQVRDHFESSGSGRKLLALGDRADLARFGPRLAEMLVYELNTYIADAPSAGRQPADRLTELIEAFPYELRDIFPPPEKIEPERASSRDLDHKESDGSRCAWEDPIHHLRLFANYLTPRKGALSADTWRAISVIIRNLTLTWLILLPLLIGVMLLGQAYLLLHPTSHAAFTCVGDGCAQDSVMVALKVILLPIAVLLISSVVMAVAWLLCNRDNSSPLDWVIQIVCLLALGALLTSAVFAIPVLHIAFKNFFYLPTTLGYFFSGPWSAPVPPDVKPFLLRLRLTVAWLIVLLVTVLIMWYWGIDNRELGGNSAESLSSWKRDVRRGRFSQAQSKLLVTTAVVGAVLLLSWFTCLLRKDHQITLGIKIPFALVPLLSAVGGSVFTALRATPTSNVDRNTTREPAWTSRFIFAATPPLVVGVLAVAAAWFAHSLILNLYNKDSIYPLLNVAAVLAIALCMALGVYELEDVRWSRVIKASLAPIVFICLITIDVSWGWQALFHYRYSNQQGPWLYLVLTSAVLAIVITIAFFRVVPKGKWKWRLFRHLDFVRRRVRSANDKNKNVRVLRLLSLGSLVAAATLFGVLTSVGFGIGALIYLNTTDKMPGRIFGAVVLTTLGVAGGVIIFRLLINRSRSKSGENIIALRLFSEKTIGKRPEALWLAASICLTLPIVVICMGHYLYWLGKSHVDVNALWTEAPMLFPITVGLLLVSLMILRSLVIQKWLLEDKPIVGWAGGIFDWLYAKIPGAGEHRRRAYQFSAFSAICFVSLLDTIVRGFSSVEAATTMGLGPVNWKLMAAAFFVSLPVFGVSVFQIRPAAAALYPKFDGKPRKWLHSKGFLWTLATVCVGFALLAGLLLPNWLKHVSDIPMHKGLTPILLPVAAGCFLIVLFEMYWGERDSQRSLLLVAFAYLAVASIFFMNLAEASLHWHLVPGLLAAICVWVGALGWMVDPNAVSMHQFYKGRLVRAYLGASNVLRFKHRNKEITETVAGDDLLLKSLSNCDRGGPYYLINTTLNLVAGRDLATAQRSASSFVLSQKYCGSTRTNYCLTDEYMNGQLTLGTAVAASGAAVSPNMGTKKPTAALAMLMTLLNVRLGYWAPTPNRRGWNSSQPRLWPFYLVREFLSQTNDLSDYCYLTDGGHFDNTGLYSLIERGCRYVVLVDCGADPTPPCFQDLGEAIRRCRIDFGTEIDLNLDPFIKSQCPATASCFVVGRIVFSEDHLRSLGPIGQWNSDFSGELSERTGIIVYFKPSVIANVTADVRQYAIENSFFPQQPTTNQWFGEAQFESYRRLGQFCANSAFGQVEAETDLESGGKISMRKIDDLFAGLYARTKESGSS